MHIMIKNYILTLFLIVFAIQLAAQTESSFAGARAGGMANAGVTLSDSWAVFNNPAAMSGIDRPVAGIFYENRWLLKQTGYGALAFTSPLLGGNIGIGITNFGYSLFQSNKFSLGFSQQLFQNFSMGVMIDYFSVRQSGDYGNLNAINFEVGLLSRPSENFAIGVHVFNPLNFSYFEDSDLKMPIAFKLGFSYLFSKSLLIAVETAKAINGYVPLLRTGIEYTINNQFSFRTGVAVAPVEYAFGLGYNTGDISFDLAYAYHEVLGSTPKISISYAF